MTKKADLLRWIQSTPDGATFGLDARENRLVAYFRGDSHFFDLKPAPGFEKDAQLPQYSGSPSQPFWARVKATKEPFIYDMGVLLQDVEHRVLAALSAGERMAAQRKKRRPRQTQRSHAK
jgi:hypothetical protein